MNLLHNFAHTVKYNYTKLRMVMVGACWTNSSPVKVIFQFEWRQTMIICRQHSLKNLHTSQPEEEDEEIEDEIRQ